jgi:PAS domain S-box-containing protein
MTIPTLPEAPTQDRATRALRETIAALQCRLAESEQALGAIRAGEVDAIRVTTSAGELVFSLKGAEQPYREMIEAMGESVVNVTPDGLVLYCNQRFSELTKTDPGTIMGSGLQAYFTGQDRTRITTALRAYGTTRSRAQILRADGVPVPVHVAMRRAANDDGPNVVITVISDLTTIVAAQEAIAQSNQQLEQRLTELHASEHRYQSLLETMNDGLIETDDIPTLTYVNPRFAEMLGYTADNLLGRPATQFLANGALAQVHERVGKRKAGHSEVYELAWLHYDGHEIPTRMSARPHFGPDGRYTGSTASVTDLTDQKRAEEELADHQRHLEDVVAERTADLAAANQALNSSNHELESFAYSVSHDLRAPLRAIDGFSHVLEEDYGDKLDAEAKHLMQVICDGVAKMARLIDDILAFSRAARREIAASAIDMDGLVQAALSDLAPAMTGRKIKVEVVALPPMRGDREMLQRVWMNLLDNAIKFTGHKESALIEVGSYPEAESTVYFVKDNGAGFDMTYVGKLFGVFQRLHGPEDFPGTGAGLAIVKRIVGRHGGRVWAEGKVGEGATFYCALPRDDPAHV